LPCLPRFAFNIIDSFNSIYGGISNPPTGFGCGDTYYLATEDLQSGSGFYSVFVDSTNNPTTDFSFSSFPVASNIPEGGGGGYYPVGSTFTRENTQNTVLNTLIDWGTNVLAILGAVLAIALAYLIFRFGWKQTKRVIGNPNGERFIEHSAEDLEFKRNFGNLKKPKEVNQSFWNSMSQDDKQEFMDGYNS